MGIALPLAVQSLRAAADATFVLGAVASALHLTCQLPRIWLQAALLEALAEVMRHGGEGGQTLGLPWLQAVLDTPQVSGGAPAGADNLHACTFVGWCMRRIDGAGAQPLWPPSLGRPTSPARWSALVVCAAAQEPPPLVLSDFSPLRVAFQDQDTSFNGQRPDGAVHTPEVVGAT